MIKSWIVVGIASGVLLGCQALLDPGYPDLVRDVTREVQELVEAKADAGEVLTAAEIQALIERAVEIHTKGTPLEGGALGALIASILGLTGTWLSTRRQLAAESAKNSRKRGEMWAALESASGPKS